MTEMDYVLKTVALLWTLYFRMLIISSDSNAVEGNYGKMNVKDSSVRTLNRFVWNQTSKPSRTTFFHQLIDNLLNDIDDLQVPNQGVNGLGGVASVIEVE